MSNLDAEFFIPERSASRVKLICTGILVRPQRLKNVPSAIAQYCRPTLLMYAHACRPVRPMRVNRLVGPGATPGVTK